MSVFYVLKNNGRSSDKSLVTGFKKLKLAFYIVCLGIGLMFFSRFVTYSTKVYNMSKLMALDFEVFGTVQGVFFRKHTQKKGQELGLKGWCMNTDKGTVVGQLEGEAKKVEEMKRWLQLTGSPQSAIDKTVFQNEKEIAAPSFTSFDIRK